MKMATHRITDSLCSWGGLGILTWGLSVTPVWARSDFPDSEIAAPCARVQSFEGDVQILDESRTRVREVKFGEGIACGSWVSATAGWIRMKHRDGWSFSLAPGSFAQLLNPPSLGGDQLLLFKGSSYIRVTEGSPQVQVLTANSRVKIPEGAGTVAYLSDTEETQWMSASGRSSIENRFQSERPVRVAAGELSSLNFRQLRVVPSEPTAVSSAQMKRRLEDFRLDEAEVNMALASARTRQDRRIASVIGAAPVPVQSVPEGKAGVKESHSATRIVVQENPHALRQPASHPEVTHASEPSSHAGKAESTGSMSALQSDSPSDREHSDYSRHPGATPEVQEEVRSALGRKLAGHGPVSEDMISPDEGLPQGALPNGHSGGHSELKVQEIRHSSPSKKKKRISGDDEKKRILEELSKIKVE